MSTACDCVLTKETKEALAEVKALCEQVGPHLSSRRILAERILAALDRLEVPGD